MTIKSRITRTLSSPLQLLGDVERARTALALRDWAEAQEHVERVYVSLYEAKIRQDIVLDEAARTPARRAERTVEPQYPGEELR